MKTRGNASENPPREGTGAAGVGAVPEPDDPEVGSLVGESAEEVGETVERFPHGSHPEESSAIRKALSLVSHEQAQVTLNTLLSAFAREDLGLYTWFVHGLKPAAHQEIWCAWEGSSARLKCYITPTGHGKTQFIGQSGSEHEIGRNPNTERLHYLSNTPAQATKVGRSVMRTIEHNRNFKVVFPGVVPDGSKWGQEAFLVQRGWAHTGLKDDTMVCAGVFGPINGLRATRTKWDDVSDLENTSTKYQSGKVREFFEQVVIRRLVPGGYATNVMTRWNDLDIFQWVCSLKGMVVIHMPALGFWEHADEQLAQMGGSAVVSATKDLLTRAKENRLKVLHDTAEAEGIRLR